MAERKGWRKGINVEQLLNDLGDASEDQRLEVLTSLVSTGHFTPEEAATTYQAFLWVEDDQRRAANFSKLRGDLAAQELICELQRNKP